MKVTEYEGAKVPEGATHLSASVPVGYFCKFIGKDAYFFFGQEWKKSNAYGVYIKDNLTELPEQPTKAGEWVPVGRCIHLYNDGSSEPVPLAMEDVTIIGTDKLGNYVFQNDKSECYYSDPAEYFIKPKTAEEKKREYNYGEILKMLNLIHTSDFCPVEAASVLAHEGFTAPEGNE